MIKEFSVKNFLSFKDEVTLSMEALAESVSEYPSNVININNNKLLKVSSIYGPNASGKSNLLKAILYLKNFVLSRNYILGNYKEVIGYRKDIRTDLDQFKIADKLNNVTTFKLFTTSDSYDIGYILELEKNDDVVYVKHESLSFLNENNEYDNIFERNYNVLSLSDNLSDNLKRDDFILSDQITFISFLKFLYLRKSGENEGHLKIIESFANEIENIKYLSYNSRPLSRNTIQFNYLKNESFKKRVTRILNNLDIRIKDIVVEETPAGPKVYLLRELDGKIYQMELKDESDGTVVLLYLITIILMNIDMKSTLLIDEIDTHLHPKLTREIIKLFQSEENKHSQLIFTSHDILNMDNDLFRRDEIWFVVKNKNFSSELFSLTDIINYKGEKVRKDAKFGKQYLEGRYGADPFIKKGIKWNE